MGRGDHGPVGDAAFGVLALIAYVRGFRSAAFAPVAGALLLVSLLCKGTGAVILLLMIQFEWIEAQADRSSTPRAAALRLAPALAIAADLICIAADLHRR